MWFVEANVMLKKVFFFFKVRLSRMIAILFRLRTGTFSVFLRIYFFILSDNVYIWCIDIELGIFSFPFVH